jgi:hypothetical protein
MQTKVRRVSVLMSSGIFLAASTVATPVFAEAPQAVTITTTVVFNPNTSGTFVATGPICASGTVEFVDEVVTSGSAFNVNALQRFVCDDSSGSFILRLHPQANARPREGFDLSGPWSVWGKGTGDYASLAGHGDFGVVLDFSADPLTGTETYVGFVTL